MTILPKSVEMVLHEEGRGRASAAFPGLTAPGGRKVPGWKDRRGLPLAGGLGVVGPPLGAAGPWNFFGVFRSWLAHGTSQEDAAGLERRRGAFLIIYEVRQLARNSLKVIREQLLMSKAELARKAGVSPLTIDRIENGKSCRMETMRKIILALGYTLEDKDKIFAENM